MSAMGKASQRVQQAARIERMAERLQEQAEWDVLNYPRKQGSPLGSLQWHDFRTGKVRRWTVRIGDRMDRITLEMNGKKTDSHGWSWVLDRLRGFLAGTKV